MQSKIIEVPYVVKLFSEKVFLTYFLYSLLLPGDKLTSHFEKTDAEPQLGQSQLQLDLCLKYYKFKFATVMYYNHY